MPSVLALPSLPLCATWHEALPSSVNARWPSDSPLQLREDGLLFSRCWKLRQQGSSCHALRGPCHHRSPGHGPEAVALQSHCPPTPHLPLQRKYLDLCSGSQLASTLQVSGESNCDVPGYRQEAAATRQHDPAPGLIPGGGSSVSSPQPHAESMWHRGCCVCALLQRQSAPE